VERDKKHLLLLLDDDCQLFLLFLHNHSHLIVLWLSEHLLKVLRLLFEFANAHDIPFDFVFDDAHGGVSDLVLDQEVLEVGEVRVRLEHVEEVESQVDRLLVVVTEGTTDSSEQSLVLQHELHVLVREAKVEECHSAFGFALDLLIVELLEVVFEEFDSDLGKVNFRFVGGSLDKENICWVRDDELRLVEFFLPWLLLVPLYYFQI